MNRLVPTLLVLFACISAADEGCEEVEVLLEPEADVRVGHWQFVGPIGVRVCSTDREVLDDEARRHLRNAYEEIIADLTLFSLRLCWTEPPNEQWTASMVREFKRPHLERLNEVLPTPVLREVTCELGFVEYAPRVEEDGTS